MHILAIGATRKDRSRSSGAQPRTQPQQQLEGRRQPPPHGGQYRQEAEGEQPGMPRPGHVEDDGDARLENGRVDGGG